MHNTKCLHKEVREIHTSKLTEHLKALEQKEANSPKRNRSHKIMKLKAGISKLKQREQYKESIKQRVGSLKISAR